jgi:hypothetical protein
MVSWLGRVVRARKLAEQTGTDLIVMRSGKVVHLPPKQKSSSRD